MEDEVKTSTRAALNGRVERTFNLKGPNWVNVPGGRILTPDMRRKPAKRIILI